MFTARAASRKRDERLNHHQELGPGRQNRRVSGRECSAGVESKKQIIHETRTPALLTHVTFGLLVERHLRKQKGSVRVDAAQLTGAGAACKHCSQMESNEPSLFLLCGNKGVSGRSIARPLSGENFNLQGLRSGKMFN
jgi:hypothetical protein